MLRRCGFVGRSNRLHLVFHQEHRGVGVFTVVVVSGRGWIEVGGTSSGFLKFLV